MNRREVILAAGALGGFTALGAFADSFEAGLGKPAPQFEAVDGANRKRTLKEFAGKPVVLEWTSPSCPFVRAQYQSGVMQETQRWATARGAVWLTVLSTHPTRQDFLPPEKAEAMSRMRQAAPTAVLLDPEGVMGRAYGAVVTPHMYVIAPDGRLVYAGGAGDKSTMDAEVVRASRNYVRAALEDLAAGRKVATPSSAPFGCTIAYSGR